MRILVIGRGGREHAIIWKLKQSPKVTKLYCAPGNAGIAELAECVPIDEGDFAALGQFAKQAEIDLAVVGPEDPLFAGAVDYFEELGIPAFGPRKNAAIIEGSKVFAKQLMKQYAIPSAAYEAFDNYDEAKAYLDQQAVPIVIKADGLAAGKGVTVAQTREQAEQALKDIMLDKVFGSAGAKVVIEEYLEGQEMTILAFVDGTVVRPMVPSQDHKPVYDNDQGPNTGGMGTYSPVPHIPQSIVDQAIQTILQPAAEAMVQEGRPFRGILYAGLMITEQGPKTIEFNCRFGDPETQVVLPRLKSDLLEIMLATLNGKLQDIEIEWTEEAAVCVVLASGGYPGAYEKGKTITGLRGIGQEPNASSIIFHAGTALTEDGRVVTNGGRVLGVTGLGSNLEEARKEAYAEVARVEFEGCHYRKDIAMKAMLAQQQ